MQIKFAGQIIAQDPANGGLDAIQGFVPTRKSNTQWAEYLRAKDAVPINRGNRKRTITGKITPTPYDDYGTAVQALLLFLDTLPDTGPLLIQAGTKSTVFANASFDSVTEVKINGISIAVSLTFLTGPGNDYSTPIQDESGNPIQDESGSNILPG
jgi:hypothetical protein